MKVMYPGSFDPITLGHLDIIQRASEKFDEVYVVIMQNKKKTCSFTLEERQAMIEKCVHHLSNVKVVIGNGLTVNFAKSIGCGIMLRGIRAVADYETELALATGNMALAPDIETVFLVAKPEYSFLSSSIAKEVAYFGGDLSTFIPEPILEEVSNRLKS